MKKDTQKRIRKIIDNLVINKKEGANKNTSKELYRMRYGSDWQRYYPA